MGQGPVLPANNLDRFLGEQDFATARGMWLCSDISFVVSMKLSNRAASAGVDLQF